PRAGRSGARRPLLESLVRSVGADNKAAAVELVVLGGALAAMITIDQGMAPCADEDRLGLEYEVGRPLQRLLDIKPEQFPAMDDAVGREAEGGDIGRGKFDVVGVERHDAIEVPRVEGVVMAAGELGVVHATPTLASCGARCGCASAAPRVSIAPLMISSSQAGANALLSLSASSGRSASTLRA